MSDSKRIMTGEELGRILIEQGIIPPLSGDVVIEVPIEGVVVVHTAVFGDERLSVVPSRMKEFGIERRSTGNDRAVLPSRDVSCLDAADILVSDFERDVSALFVNHSENRNELVRRIATLLAMQREALRKEAGL